MRCWSAGRLPPFTPSTASLATPTPCLGDSRARFDDVLAELESVAGWKTARVQRPVQILGSLDGIETGVRQLIRREPLETEVIDVGGAPLTVPTRAGGRTCKLPYHRNRRR